MYKDPRMTWEAFFFANCELQAKRSTCTKREVGCVIVRDTRIISSGYNGAPAGTLHCTEDTCLRKDVKSGERHELCKGVHAEQNAIIQAAKFGVSLDGADMYVTHKPCFICIKMILNVGIKRVFFKHDYPDSRTNQIIAEEAVKLQLIHVV